jgi:hypothetical protein
MIIGAKLGFATRFASFDTEMNYFKVDSTLLTEENVGKYEITVTAIIVADKYLRKEF